MSFNMAWADMERQRAMMLRKESSVLDLRRERSLGSSRWVVTAVLIWNRAVSG